MPTEALPSWNDTKPITPNEDRLPSWDESREVFPSWEESRPEQSVSPSLSASALPPGASRSPEALAPLSAFEAGPSNAIVQSEQERLASAPEMTGPEIKEALMELAMQGAPIPPFGAEGTFTRGVSKTLAGAAQFATSPVGIGLVGAAAIPGVGPAITGYFLGDVTKGAAEKAGEASVTGSREAAGEAAALGVMAAGIGRHMFKSAAEVNVPARRLAAELDRSPLEPSLLPRTDLALLETDLRPRPEQQPQGRPNAIQEQIPNEGVLREEGQTVGLRQVDEAHAQPQAPAQAQEIPSVGAAAVAGSGEFGQGTALKNATGTLERALHGLPDAYPGEVQKMLPAWVRSAEEMAKQPDAGFRLAEELKHNPERGLTGDESALLLRHKVALENAKNQAAEDTFTARTPEAKVEAEKRFQDASDKLLDLLDTTKFRGSQWGREGRWRQAMAFEDFSLETMRRDKRVALDRELTPAEETQVRQLNERIAELERQLRERETADVTGSRVTAVEESVREIGERTATETKREKAAGVERDLVQERADAVADLKTRFMEQEGSLEGGNASVRKLMELLWLDGIRERVKMETAVHDILRREADPTITLEQTQDLMSGYGKFKELSKEPVKVGVRGIVGEIQQVRKLLDFFKGQAPAKTGVERRIPTDKERALQKVVNEAKKRFGTTATDPARSLKSALDAIETRLRNRLADLRQEVSTRKRIVKERAPSPYNAETQRLRGEIEKVQKEWDEIFGRPELTPEQRLKRAEDAALRQENELQRQLRTGEIFPKGKVTSEQRSAILDAAKARIEALKEEREWARMAAQPQPEIIAREIAKEAETLDRQINDIENQIENEAVFPKGNVAKEVHPENEARRAKLAALKERRQWMRERLQPKPEVAAVEAARRSAALDKQIAEIERQLRTEEVGGKSKKPKPEETAENQTRLARLKSLKEEREYLRERLFQKTPESGVLEVQRRSAALDKQIAELERQIRTEEVGPKSTRRAIEDTPENKARLDRINALKEERENIRERLFQPTEEIEVRQLRQILERYRRLETSYKDRLAKGDFAKRERKEQPSSEATIAAKVKLDAAKQQFLKGLHEDRMAKRTRQQKIWSGIKETIRAYRTTKAGADLSAPRQAIAFLLRVPAASITNPIGTIGTTAKAFGNMFSAAMSEAKAKAIEQRRIRDRPNSQSGLDKAMGLDYTDLDATKFTRYEENARSVIDDWAKLPYRTGSTAKTIATAVPRTAAKILHASNRGFITFLNTARAGLADEIIRTRFKDRPPTAQEARDIGYLVNLMTGRGELGPRTAEILGTALWSPNLLASRLKLLTGGPLLHPGSARTKSIVAREYANALVGTYALWKVAKIFNEPQDQDAPITSSDFRKVVRGNTRIDLLGGFQQPLVAGAKLVTGEKTTLSGKTQNLGDFGVPSHVYVIADFARSKLSPELGVALDLLARENYIGQTTDVRTEEGRANLLRSAIPIPLAWNEIIPIMREHGMTEAMIIEALALLGAGVSQHEELSKQR